MRLSNRCTDRHRAGLVVPRSGPRTCGCHLYVSSSAVQASVSAAVVPGPGPADSARLPPPTDGATPAQQ